MKIVADANIPFVKECFSSVGDVKIVPGRQMTPQIVADADGLLVRSVTPVNSTLLDKSRVRFVGTATIGTEHIDIDYLNSQGIGFASAPGSNANSVAEYVVAALLSVAQKKKITLEDKSIGIIGVGNVGSKVDHKCKALGMKTFLNDPPLQRQTQDEKYRPLKELFDCDFITMHTPLTGEGQDKTFHLANREFFDNLKNGAVFINTSRGGVVDTDALKDAIQKGKLGGIILDVWENEPNIDYDLLRCVDISTPHIAGYSFDGKVAGMMMIYEAFCKHFDMNPKKQLDEFLPAPAVPAIFLEDVKTGTQKYIHEMVQHIYPINRDDFNMREILMVDENQRPQFFDDLRKQYPIRREFQNTTIQCEKRQAQNCQLVNILKGIGFKACE